MVTAQTDSEPSGQALPTGTRLVEFVIERVLGSGGFGITYLARDTSLNRQVVIKENLPAQFAWRETTTGTVRPRHTSNGDADDYEWSMNNFLREAETLASLDHPGIVRVLRKFEANGTAYFVMPFVEGVAFDTLIEDRRAKGHPVSDEELNGLLTRVLDALGYLHDRGIYHRDIKPGNILISNDGIPALIDFGSARQRLSERSMTVVESAGYTPFEQLQTRGNVGPWSDLYALAATIEKAITSKAPPKAADRIGNDPRIPLATRQDAAGRYSPALLASIDQALAVDEKKRWQIAGQWQEALAAGPVEAPVQISTKFNPDPAEEWERKSRLSTVAQSAAWNEDEPVDSRDSQKPTHALRDFVAIVALLAVIGIVIWIFSQRNSTSEPATVATEQSPAVTPASNGEPAPKPTSPASPFAAASMAPSAWAQMAESGDPLAQALLGDALYWGGQKSHGIQMDPAEGVKWIEKSANAGNSLGHYLLGLAREGDGKWLPRDEDAAKQDYAEAVRLGLVRDAENGGPVWWTAVAQVLERGKGVSADPKTAVMWYRKAAEVGYVDGMGGLGDCYRLGSGTVKDEVVAVTWYRKSAEAGSPSGMLRLADCYDTAIGLTEDDAAAVSWFRKAAEAGSSRGMAMLGSAYYYGQGVPKDPSEAVKWCRLAADQGNAEGQTLLGECYAEGEGVPKDLTEAVKWYQKAADLRHAGAQVLLGTAYDFGDGVAENPSMAVKWYRKAADQGYAEGQSNLGDCYRDGTGVQKDRAEAVKWYRLAAEHGDMGAQNNLGDCYRQGEGVAKDASEAVKWYRKGADQGNAVAQRNLGFCYFDGVGLTKDAVSAVKWIKMAAEQGESSAQSALGDLYLDGAGVAKDASEAAKWFRRAADQGVVYAQSTLGMCYYNGQGVTKDFGEAVKWYRKAAEKGEAGAQNNLGISYENGQGVAKNDTESVKWYRRSADQGNPNGLFNLGRVYNFGSQGVPQDMMKAYKVYILAASAGNTQAKISYEAAARMLTREQVDTVQQACRDWKPKLETENR